MYFMHWVFIALAGWFGVEFGLRHRATRVSLQFFLLTCIAAASFSAGAHTSVLSVNLRANNQLKNLTRGLVAITTNDVLDGSPYRKRLSALHNRVIPTYETIAPSRTAVEEFLGSYGIGYEEEIPMVTESMMIPEEVENSPPSEQRK
jgi:hypothetical protein